MAIVYGDNIYLPPSPVTPPFLTISSITRANPMVVTVTTPNSYVAGQKVHFTVPFNYGMTQLNQVTGEILSVSSSNLILTVAINSTQFDSFTIPSSGSKPATIAPAGSKNIYNIIQASFRSVDGMEGN